MKKHHHTPVETVPGSTSKSPKDGAHWFPEKNQKHAHNVTANEDKHFE